VAGSHENTVLGGSLGGLNPCFFQSRWLGNKACIRGWNLTNGMFILLNPACVLSPSLIFSTREISQFEE
jgi:hypothetical protein